MRFIIVGTGAIGGSVGGLLADAGHDVVLVARGDHGKAIEVRGLLVETPMRRFTVRPTVVPEIAQLDPRAGDVVVLAVKVHDAAAALQQLTTVFAADTPVLCLTNGLEAERLALRHFTNVYGVCVNCPASYLRAGVVQAWGTGTAGVLDVGRFLDGVDVIANNIAAAFRSAGFASHPRVDIMRYKREKLLTNLGNAIEALCGDGAGQEHLDELARAEGIACYAAAGLSRLADEERAAQRAKYGVGMIDGNSRSGGSTWQSLARGSTRTEVDYLNGEIALLGRMHGVPTPVNVGLQRVVNEASRRGVVAGAMSVEELRRQLGLIS